MENLIDNLEKYRKAHSENKNDPDFTYSNFLLDIIKNGLSEETVDLSDILNGKDRSQSNETNNIKSEQQSPSQSGYRSTEQQEDCKGNSNDTEAYTNTTTQENKTDNGNPFGKKLIQCMKDMFDEGTAKSMEKAIDDILADDKIKTMTKLFKMPSESDSQASDKSDKARYPIKSDHNSANRPEHSRVNILKHGNSNMQSKVSPRVNSDVSPTVSPRVNSNVNSGVNSQGSSEIDELVSTYRIYNTTLEELQRKVDSLLPNQKTEFYARYHNIKRGSDLEERLENFAGNLGLEIHQLEKTMQDFESIQSRSLVAITEMMKKEFEYIRRQLGTTQRELEDTRREVELMGNRVIEEIDVLREELEKITRVTKLE